MIESFSIRKKLSKKKVFQFEKNYQKFVVGENNYLVWEKFLNLEKSVKNVIQEENFESGKKI